MHDEAVRRIQGDPDLFEVAEAAGELEHQHPAASVDWAWKRFGTDAVVAASFQDCVLIDVVSKVAPRIEVVFLDTQYHFVETLSFVEQVRDRYDLNLRIMTPLVGLDDAYKANPDECCSMRKLEPLSRAVSDKRCWITGLRRSDTPARAITPVVHFDLRRGLVKVNPLASLSDDDVAAYKRDNDLLEHPLSTRGYASIGCWPCTKAVAPGGARRSGRWAGTEKTECGLHE